MNAQQAILFLAALLTLPSGEAVNTTDPSAAKEAIIAIAAAAGLDVEGFPIGDPGERFLEYSARAMAAWGNIPIAAVRALFFSLATDPGDVDDFGVPDGSVDQTPRPGMLSAVGAGFYNTIRGGQTFATTFVSIRNAGTTVATFSAGQLVAEYSTSTLTLGTPTYISTADPSIYNGIGGTLTLAPNGVATLPFQAQQLGAYGSAPSNEIDTIVTQSFGTLVATASTTAIGEEREPRADYITRCLLAPASNSPGGPGEAYRRAMNTNRDGTLLQRFDGSGPVTINQAYVSPSSATGVVTMYVGGPAGAVDDIDVSSCTANVSGLTLGVITAPLGVLPDTVTLGPTTDDPNIIPSGTPGAASCINKFLPVHYSVKIKSKVAGDAAVGAYFMPWRPVTVYATGQRVQNGVKLYVCAAGGTSASGGGPTATGSGISDGTVTWNFAGAGLAVPAAITSLFSLITSALSAYTLSAGIGALEQVAGAGVIYTSDMQDAVRDAAAGLYAAALSLPSTTTSAIPLGNIGIAGAGIDGSLTSGTITGSVTVV